MSVPYSNLFSARETPQSEPIPGTSQVPNSAGGFAWAVDDWVRLDRFLILGTEGGSYYATERKLTVQSAEAVLRCIAADGPRVVRRVVEISDAGRAPKNDSALFVLAMAFGPNANPETRAAALEALPKVARIGTHLFTFLAYVQDFRGWGRGLKRAISRWYLEKDPDALAYQMAKYRQRGQWSHRDALRLAHPTPKTLPHKALFHWATKSEKTPKEGVDAWAPLAETPTLVLDFTELQRAKSALDVLRALDKNQSLSWEMIPTQFLGEAKVWEALYPRLPMTALLRNLARMTASGVVAPLGAAARHITARIVDADAIKKARVHPIAVLSALRTYAKGRGIRGSLQWSPVSTIIDALDQAFYLAFGNVTVTGKNWLLGLDISSSMDGGEIAGVPGLTPREAAAAMALVTARVEPSYALVGFCEQLALLNLSPKQRLDDVIRFTKSLRMGRTDCSLPMVWATEAKVPVDAFVTYTDNETYAGSIHPAQALRRYREKMGRPAKLIVVAMTANDFTVADPNDAGMLDVVGFDASTPELIADFGAH